MRGTYGRRSVEAQERHGEELLLLRGEGDGHFGWRSVLLVW